MNKKLLIIDEETWYVDYLVEYIKFKFPNCIYDYAFNGVNAMTYFERNEYNCIILDIMMPYGTEEIKDQFAGLIVLEEIRNRNATIPIICYTARNEDNVKKTINKYSNTKMISKQDSIDLFWKELEKYIL